MHAVVWFECASCRRVRHTCLCKVEQGSGFDITMLGSAVGSVIPCNDDILMTRLHSFRSNSTLTDQHAARPLLICQSTVLILP